VLSFHHKQYVCPPYLFDLECVTASSAKPAESVSTPGQDEKYLFSRWASQAISAA
jgi:hypothetical protein